MDLEKLANALIKDENVKPLDYYEERYPLRDLPKGAQVTRFAPSPTGYLHFGGIFGALADERLAHQSGGVVCLRIEDTDAKREVEGAVDVILNGFRYFGIRFDEGAQIGGEYGPYYQRARAEIYHAYAKDLIKRGLAYPDFSTEEELAAVREYQTANKLLPGCYGEFAKGRNLTEEEIYANLEAGKPYVIRLKSQGDVTVKHTFHDEIKGDITVTENNIDVVLLKSDGIPTYHFAHAIDDHFLRTTTVIRGEEWLSSLPIHIELFKALGFRLPKFAHTCSIQKIDERDGSRRKISKRKDPEATVTFYQEEGYHPEAVKAYIMTLLNSNFEEWSLKFPDKPLEEFKFSLSKMSVSGALFDMTKLNDVSKNVVSKLSEEEAFDFLKKWADEYGTEEQRSRFSDKEYMLKALALCMGTKAKKRRKDFITAKQSMDVVSYFFDGAFHPVYEYRLDKQTAREILEKFKEKYSYADDNAVWFNKVKEVGSSLGFCADMKEYKAHPENYRGNVSDVAEVVRIAITGLSNTPDLWTIMQILGEERCRERLERAIARL